MAEPSSPPLPAGRGNDYVRTLGLPLDPVEAARHLGTARERRVDLGYVNGKPFLGVASLGFEAMANEYANRSRFKRGPVYIWGALRAILAVRPLHLSLDTGDGPVPSTPLSVQVCQTGRYGGGVVLVPDASIEDGLLDLVVEAPPSRIPYVGFLLAMVSGHHTRPSWLHHSRVSAVHIGGSPEILVYADGDPIDHLPVDVAIERQVVRLLA
ncbi:diacylglycerol/lipid kinase family protein [Acidipropionibacterium timonense]|uniref:diacylglycerol/lipid kinase family protein n=1 Tax=Acidipropionibacterium timonense TaxID=2161818 RepID=UPI0010316508|nr:hypothetical protein [Acidipropionibacterium timonense]